MFNKQCFREVPCWKMNSRWVTVSLSSWAYALWQLHILPTWIVLQSLSCILLVTGVASFATPYCSTPGFPVPTWTQHSNLYLRPSPFLSPPDCYIQLPTCHLFIVQSLSHVLLFATPWNAACQASLSFTISWTLLKLMSIELVMPSNRFVLCHPVLLLPSVFPSIRVFSNESGLYFRWSKYWSISFSISPSNEYSGLISFRMDWLDLLAVQGTLKSLLQHYSSKASILQHSTCFLVQLSHPYMTTRKTIFLTIMTFVTKMVSLLFNRLSRFVIVSFQGATVF